MTTESLKCIGCIEPLVPLLEALEHHAIEFAAETWRQDTPGSPHFATKALFLRMPPGRATRESIFESLDVIDRPLMGEPAFRDAVAQISALAGLPPARVLFAALRPNGVIPQHIDEGAYAAATHRYHLCASTNPWAAMSVGSTMAQPRPGEVWFFNKHRPHSVCNFGPTWRVHLIVDCWRAGRSAGTEREHPITHS
jgi:hypothetical protein